MKYIFIILILFAAHSAFSQKVEVIGFACGFGGGPTRSVTLMDSLVEIKNFKTLKNKLQSDNSAEKCLSVIICEILETKEIIRLSKEEKEFIIESYKSQDELSLCSGCTYHGQTTIKDFLNKTDQEDSRFSFRDQAEKRYKEIIEKTTNR